MRRPGSAGSLLALLCLLACEACPAPAEEALRLTTFTLDGAWSPGDNLGYGVGDGGFAPISFVPVENPGTLHPAPDGGRDLGYGWGSVMVQAMLTRRTSWPFLVGTGALTSENHLLFAFSGALTPVSVRLEAQAALTPVAFLDVFAGAMLGTGWSLGTFYGLGLNSNGSGVPESAPFPGLVSRLWSGVTVKFDLGAVVPGKWTHVVVLFRPQLQYSLFSGAGRGESWAWEADGGENFNGVRFRSTGFLGWRPPGVLDTIGLFVETEQNLGYVRDLSPMAAGGWGSDHVQVTLGPLLGFTLSEADALTVLCQFRRERLYDDSSIFANYFQNRRTTGTYWDFYRIAFSWERRL